MRAFGLPSAGSSGWQATLRDVGTSVAAEAGQVTRTADVSVVLVGCATLWAAGACALLDGVSTAGATFEAARALAIAVVDSAKTSGWRLRRMTPAR